MPSSPVDLRPPRLPLTSLLPLLALVPLLSGCWVPNMLSSRPSPSVTFDDADVPPGTGWFCFGRQTSHELTGLCERTASACDASRTREQDRGAAVTVCRPSRSAACYFLDVDPTKAAVMFPVGDREKKVGCFTTPEECQSVRDNRLQTASTGSGIVGVSACRQLD